LAKPLLSERRRRVVVRSGSTMPVRGQLADAVPASDAWPPPTYSSLLSGIDLVLGRD
jgi:hypothetical protein